MAMYVTGDTHGEQNRFLYTDSIIDRTLGINDKLCICGDFGYLMNDSYLERQYLDFLAEKQYQILWVDGNHENFDLLERYPVEIWCGGKVHIIRRDELNQPKIIHLMRGQIFEIEGKKIFTMGGGYSRDKEMRIPYRSWWPQELPSQVELDEGLQILKLHNHTVDYILSHTPPESTMIRMGYHATREEQPFAYYLDGIKNTTSYTHWWFGHLHQDKSINPLHQTGVCWALRDMLTNEVIPE